MKFSVLLLTFLLGCNSSKNMNTSMNKNYEYSQVSFETLIEDQMGGYVKEEIRVISDRKSLLEVYGYVNRIRKPGFSIPEIDFSKETVIAVFMGEKTTGGYGVIVEDVKEEKGKLVVAIKETKPSPGDMIITVITQPFCVVKINSSNKELVFKKQ